MSIESVQQQPKLPEGYHYHPEGYLWFVLPVQPFMGLPERVDVEGTYLERKTEFHVTVINARKVAKDIALADPTKDPQEIEHGLLALLTEYVRENPVRFVRFGNDVRLARTSDQVSLAGRCMMQGVEGYFEEIRARYGYLPPAQPTHVSLYTLPGKGAVGIDTVEEMEAFQRVDLPQIQQILDAVPGFRHG